LFCAFSFFVFPFLENWRLEREGLRLCAFGLLKGQNRFWLSKTFVFIISMWSSIKTEFGKRLEGPGFKAIPTEFEKPNLFQLVLVLAIYILSRVINLFLKNY
jgi:hypothetical protein